MSADQYKKLAGELAANEDIQSGMVVGLGTGTTAVWMVRRLAERLDAGELTDIVGIPTSTRTAEEAERLGIPLVSLETHPVIDVTIDGADEIDPQWNLIKGGGGALLREKIVAQASKHMIVVAGASKLVDKLGTTFDLPVEVTPFGHHAQGRFLSELADSVKLRTHTDGSLYVTDNHNLIYDCHFANGIDDVAGLAEKLIHRVGIVEHGLFVQIAKDVIVADAQGVRRIIR